MFDYETLRIIWWLLLGVLLIAFATMDGFDLGTGILMPFLGKKDVERRVILNTVGPVWEGNQVWLILGAGAIFAAWPALYATAFSGFYLAMFLVLASLILRPVGFKFRSKVNNPVWRGIWDVCLFIGGLVPALIFGVAFGNLIVGVPISYDVTLRLHENITLLSLLNPYSLLTGLISVAMCCLHGATWLSLKTEGEISARARKTAYIAAVVFFILFTLGGAWVTQLPSYHIVGNVVTDGPSNPLLKTVAVMQGGWWSNFHAYPILWVVPLFAYLGAIIAVFAINRGKTLLAWIGSAMIPAGVIGTAGVTLFPFLMPSTMDPSMSLTVWDTSSSKLTLEVMLVAACIFVPIIIIYTSWVYHVLRGPVTEATVADDHMSY